MAVAGAMTTAYRLKPGLLPDDVHIDRTTHPSNLCTPPAAAVIRLRNWTTDSKPPVVQGSDMARFWYLWGGVNC
jgi:hypothetical protein